MQSTCPVGTVMCIVLGLVSDPRCCELIKYNYYKLSLYFYFLSAVAKIKTS